MFPVMKFIQYSHFRLQLTDSEFQFHMQEANSHSCALPIQGAKVSCKNAPMFQNILRVGTRALDIRIW